MYRIKFQIKPKLISVLDPMSDSNKLYVFGFNSMRPIKRCSTIKRIYAPKKNRGLGPGLGFQFLGILQIYCKFRTRFFTNLKFCYVEKRPNICIFRVESRVNKFLN